MTRFLPDEEKDLKSQRGKSKVGGFSRLMGRSEKKARKICLKWEFKGHMLHSKQ